MACARRSASVGVCRRRSRPCVWSSWSVKLLCVRESLACALIFQIVVWIEGLQPLRQLVAGLVLSIVHRNRRDHLCFLTLSTAWTLNAQREEPSLTMQIHTPSLVSNPATIGSKIHIATLIHKTRNTEHISLNVAHVTLKSNRERSPLLVSKLPVQAATRGTVEITTTNVIQ